MTQPVEIQFVATETEGLSARKGRIAILVNETARLPGGLPRPTREAMQRALESDAWKALKPGKALELAFPAGIEAEALQLVLLPRRTDAQTARKAGAAIGAKLGKSGVTVLAGDHRLGADVALGLALRAYDFSAYKSKPEDEDDRPARGRVTFMHKDPETLARDARGGAALAEGVFFTRDLVSEPANVLTTSDFADRLLAMQEIGLEVEVLEEDQLAKLGMRALLGVGQGSESPSKVVVMRWNGGGDEAPLALVGKGVVFDTGGISIKPAAGMEEMTMDMGGAGVVAGVMRTLALRRARANVVGLVGLVENMPDGKAQRPGDIVKSMKGDTIEVINTDAEGRLVLADVLWYAQERFQPKAVVDLATLTGAVIIALGHDNAGVFSNDDAFADQFLAASRAEGEGAWRLPLGAGYKELIKSRLADIKNTGGRAAGSITAAEFLHCFVKDGTPWIHLDIAGVALPPGETTLAPKGASGWGVMALDRLVRDQYEAKG
ncbi:leucyl aminopeptidase [Paracoccus laeviglucosivorans]|uniref:Probable cytosol aminopeptidase n=1 Tax=Paracoccus laeviglucosivorans TaxID=1197861 RepID=A0A521CCU5_9RHOB|nr:leucyl aminopeptidase [Paracoccus laeviglucosivorans]SMO57257.1 leucyl aminopeptidase [Paracoccus laeviglucosivorans]